MSSRTSIEWTRGDDGQPGMTWNPTTGCDRVSPGCDNCYALKMAKRLKGMGQAKYQRDGNPLTSGPGFGVSMHDDALAVPIRWKKPRLVFVNSMSDLFHKDITDEFIARVFATMALTPQHTYQVLTKRHARMRALLNKPEFWYHVGRFARHFGYEHDQAANHLADGRNIYDTTVWEQLRHLPNIRLAVTVEDQKWADIRIPALLDTPADVRFLSCEPLLGPIDFQPDDHTGHERDYDGGPEGGGYVCLDCSTDEQHVEWATQEFPPGIDWAIVGGESGPGARPMEIGWAQTIVTQCRDAKVPVFVKQMGSIWASDWTIGGKTVAALGDPKGGDPQYWSEELRVREFPETPAVVAP